MKSIFSLLLLSVLAVSCGNKNSSGTKSNSESNGYTSSDSALMSIEEEQDLGTRYLAEARKVLLSNRKQISLRYGEEQFRTIERRLNMINIEISYQTIYDRDLRKNVNSFFDGHTMLLYVGTDLPNLNWRRIIQKGDSKKGDMLYEDVISLRTNGGYRYRLGNENGQGNSNNTNYHYEFSFN